MACPFTDIPKAMKKQFQFETIEVPMPDSIVSSYQKFTKSDNNKLVSIGQYQEPFCSLQEGIDRYIDYWNQV